MHRNDGVPDFQVFLDYIPTFDVIGKSTLLHRALLCGEERQKNNNDTHARTKKKKDLNVKETLLGKENKTHTHTHTLSNGRKVGLHLQVWL